jgi:Ca-activated chloride channel homolog
MKTQLQILKKTLLTSGIFIFTVLFLSAQTDRKYIRQGNGEYKDEKYPDSEISYRKAIDANKMSGDALFNLGDALYRQNKFEDAGKQFVANTELAQDRQKKSNSLYNLGNSLLKANKLQESIAAYINSLKLNPDNSHAKYNLAYAQDLLRQQQQQQQQQQDNKDQDKKDQKQNDSKDQNQQNQQQDKQSQQQQQQQQQQQTQQQISKEDAQRLLDALANDEKKVQEKVKEQKAAQMRVRTLINW